MGSLGAVHVAFMMSSSSRPPSQPVQQLASFTNETELTIRIRTHPQHSPIIQKPLRLRMENTPILLILHRRLKHSLMPTRIKLVSRDAGVKPLETMLL